MLKKDGLWWREASTTFHQLKKALIIGLVLALLDFNKEFEIEVMPQCGHGLCIDAAKETHNIFQQGFWIHDKISINIWERAHNNGVDNIKMEALPIG